MIFMKGPGCDAEVSEAVNSRGDLFRLAADHAYTIPGTTHDRRLVVFERLITEHESASPTPSLARQFMRLLGRSAVAMREITARSQSDFPAMSRRLGGPGIRKHGQAILSGARIRTEVLARFPAITCWAG